jgi:hypothetical protein
MRDIELICKKVFGKIKKSIVISKNNTKVNKYHSNKEAEYEEDNLFL